MKNMEERMAFCRSIADYVATNDKYCHFTPYTAAVEAIRVLCEDIGAAQGFLDTIGVPYDLYGLESIVDETDFGEHKWGPLA